MERQREITNLRDQEKKTIKLINRPSKTTTHLKVQNIIWLWLISLLLQHNCIDHLKGKQTRVQDKSTKLYIHQNYRWNYFSIFHKHSSLSKPPTQAVRSKQHGSDWNQFRSWRLRWLKTSLFKQNHSLVYKDAPLGPIISHFHVLSTVVPYTVFLNAQTNFRIKFPPAKQGKRFTPIYVRKRLVFEVEPPRSLRLKRLDSFLW